MSIVLRRLGVLLAVALVGVVVGTYYVDHHPSKEPPASTTTSNSTTTTTSFPSAFEPTSASGDDANYDVPASKYQVVVRGLKGPTWVVFEMGPSNTLEWQGTVPMGKVEALTMTGNSRITIGSPSNASVHVKGSPVRSPRRSPRRSSSSLRQRRRRRRPRGDLIQYPREHLGFVSPRVVTTRYATVARAQLHLQDGVVVGVGVT